MTLMTDDLNDHGRVRGLIVYDNDDDGAIHRVLEHLCLLGSGYAGRRGMG